MKTPSVTRVPEVDVVVERRTEAVQEGDATEPREGSTGCVGSSGATGGRDQSPLDLVEEDSRDGGDGSGSVCQKAPQPLRHGDHPLPHGHRRDDVIGEMRRRLCHVPAVAGRADAAALAGEGHDESLATARAPGAGEAEAEDPAGEIAAEFVLNVCRHGPLGSFPPLKPALKVLGDNPVERRLLGPATLVAAGRRGTAVRAASASRGKPCDRGDHGRTGRWTA